ncbi:MAG: helix-turn-helix transcriptional regulator [Planctomycetota bacterium]
MTRRLSGSAHDDSRPLGLDAATLAEAAWTALLADAGTAACVLDLSGTIIAASAGFGRAIGHAGTDAPASVDAALPEAVAQDLAGALQDADDSSSPVTVQIAAGGARHSVSIQRIAGDSARFIAVWRRTSGEATSDTTAADVELIAGLTARERDVLRLIGYGLSTADIAKTLHRSVKTIEWHRVALGNKLGVTNRVELARIAIRAGVSGLEPLQRHDEDEEGDNGDGGSDNRNGNGGGNGGTAGAIKADPNAA